MKSILLFLALAVVASLSAILAVVFRPEKVRPEIGRFVLQYYKASEADPLGDWRLSNQIIKMDTTTGEAWRLENHYIRGGNGALLPVEVEWTPIFKDYDEARKHYDELDPAASQLPSPARPAH